MRDDFPTFHHPNLRGIDSNSLLRMYDAARGPVPGPRRTRNGPGPTGLPNASPKSWGEGTSRCKAGPEGAIPGGTVNVLPNPNQKAG
jgi:hypothetical protein